MSFCSAYFSGTCCCQNQLSKARSSRVPSISSSTVSMSFQAIIFSHCLCEAVTCASHSMPYQKGQIMTDHHNLLDPVADIARQAGAAILEVYNKTDFDVERKDDDSPLTAADLAAHHIIVDALAKLTPEIPVHSEESEGITWEMRRAWQRYWLVDPLDGTKEFIKRNGEFTVNIALIENSVPVLGVVHVPVMGVTYLGDKGMGAFKESESGRETIQVRTAPPAVVVLVECRSHGTAPVPVIAG